MAHYKVFTTLFSSKAVNGDAKNLDLWAANLQASMAANKNADVAKAATNMSSWTIALTPPVNAAKFDKVSTLALLNAITGQADTVKTIGSSGAEQQGMAVYSLYGGLATSPDKPADAEAVTNLIVDGLFPPEGKTEVVPETFSKKLEEIKAKLPK